MTLLEKIVMIMFLSDRITEAEKSIIKWNTYLLNTPKDINKSLVKALKREKKRKENYEIKLNNILEKQND